MSYWILKKDEEEKNGGSVVENEGEGLNLDAEFLRYAMSKIVEMFWKVWISNLEGEMDSLRLVSGTGWSDGWKSIDGISRTGWDWKII